MEGQAAADLSATRRRNSTTPVIPATSIEAPCSARKDATRIAVARRHVARLTHGRHAVVFGSYLHDKKVLAFILYVVVPVAEKQATKDLGFYRVLFCFVQALFVESVAIGERLRRVFGPNRGDKSDTFAVARPNSFGRAGADVCELPRFAAGEKEKEKGIVRPIR